MLFVHELFDRNKTNVVGNSLKTILCQKGVTTCSVLREKVFKRRRVNVRVRCARVIEIAQDIPFDLMKEHIVCVFTEKEKKSKKRERSLYPSLNMMAMHEGSPFEEPHFGHGPPHFMGPPPPMGPEDPRGPPPYMAWGFPGGHGNPRGPPPPFFMGPPHVMMRGRRGHSAPGAGRGRRHCGGPATPCGRRSRCASGGRGDQTRTRRRCLRRAIMMDPEFWERVRQRYENDLENSAKEDPDQTLAEEFSNMDVDGKEKSGAAEEGKRKKCGGWRKGREQRRRFMKHFWEEMQATLAAGATNTTSEESEAEEPKDAPSEEKSAEATARKVHFEGKYKLFYVSFCFVLNIFENKHSFSRHWKSHACVCCVSEGTKDDAMAGDMAPWMFGPPGFGPDYGFGPWSRGPGAWCGMFRRGPWGRHGHCRGKLDNCWHENNVPAQVVHSDLPARSCTQILTPRYCIFQAVVECSQDADPDGGCSVT